MEAAGFVGRQLQPGGGGLAVAVALPAGGMRRRERKGMERVRRADTGQCSTLYFTIAKMARKLSRHPIFFPSA